jgi:hypothetical protein
MSYAENKMATCFESTSSADKGKSCPCACYGRYGRPEVWLYTFLTFALIDISGQLLSMAASPPRREAPVPNA